MRALTAAEVVERLRVLRQTEEEEPTDMAKAKGFKSLSFVKKHTNRGALARKRMGLPVIPKQRPPHPEKK